MQRVVLDVNVLPQIDGEGPIKNTIEKWRLRRDEIVVAPQALTEIMQAKTDIAKKLLGIISSYCDGIIGLDASALLQQELTSTNPYQAGRGVRLRTTCNLAQILRSTSDVSTQGFLSNQREGYRLSNEILIDFNSRVNEARRQSELIIPPFVQFLEGVRIDLLKAIVRPDGVHPQRVRICIPKTDTEWNRLWERAHALRLWVSLFAMNEYLSAKKEVGFNREKGCMTDLRMLFESAYADLYITSDRSLLICCQHLRNAGLLQFPKVQAVTEIIAS